MAMLDKEMADERAEAAEAEAEAMKEQLAVLEVELNVLRTEREEGERDGGEGDAEANDQARKSLAYIQLERHNERMKEALMRSVSLAVVLCELSLTRTCVQAARYLA